MAGTIPVSQDIVGNGTLINRRRKCVYGFHLRRQKHHVPLEEADQVSVESAESQALCSWDNVQILRLIHGLEDSMRC